MTQDTLTDVDTVEFDQDDTALAELEQLYGISLANLNN